MSIESEENEWEHYFIIPHNVTMNIDKINKFPIPNLTCTQTLDY